MLTEAIGADVASSSPCEITLELLRATETENPFAFVLEEQSYVRHLEGGAGRSGSFPWSEEVLDRLAAVQRERANPEAAAWLAEEMHLFLHRLGWELDEESIRKAIDAGRPVHLTLRLGAAELYALPWELVPLGATGRPLGSLPGFLLRYEWPDTHTARPEPDPPPEGGRILFAWSAAGGVVPADEHLAAIRHACFEGRHPDFDRARDVVPHTSLGRLREALRAGPVAVLHLLCHGAQLDAVGGSYGLVLDGDDRSGTEIVDARALQVALADHLGSLRLVVLCACHSGDPGALDSRLGSVAQALHRAGVPAVVASRYPLATDASVVLTEALYRGLLVQARSLADAFLGAQAGLREHACRAGWASLQMYARAADGPDLRPIVHRPYRGLLAFQEEHAQYFFGRDAEVEEAVGDLSALVAAKDAAKPRFLICTGASGTGKSSLVLAGVVPALRARDGRWVVATMRPHDGWRMSLQAALASRTDPGAPLLLVVDQLEELFTMIASHAEREAFVRDLWALASHAGSGVSVVATLRVDFLARCGEIQLWSGDRFLEDMAYDEAHRVFVRRMKPEHLRTIIEWPSARVGLSLEEGLCEQMLKDAGDEPGALPLLEYTLDQMWQQRRGGLLTWEQYNDLGGVGGALEKKADAILARFDEGRRQAARRLLVQLVTLDGDARLDRRRRVSHDKLRRGSPVEAAVFDEVLDALAHERLLVMSGGDDGAGPKSSHGEGTAGGGAGTSSVVEVAHEQLIRSWRTLRAWVREDRQMLAEMQKLDRWVEESKGFPSYVLDDDRLGHARGILARYAVDVGEAARELILRSERAATRKRRWAVGTAIGASMAALVMGVLAIWAFGERNAALTAEKQAEDARADSEEHARRAEEASEKEKQQATLAEDASVRAKQQATRARGASLVAGVRELFGRNEITAASRLLVEVSEPDTVDGWSQIAFDVLGHGFPMATFRGNPDDVMSAVFSPDGKRIATASSNGTVRVWSAEGIGAPVVLRCHKFQDDASNIYVPATAFSPDGERFLVRSVSGKNVCVWNTDGFGEPILLEGLTGTFSTAKFSPDSERIVTASSDKTARIWNADGSGMLAILEGHAAPVIFAAFSSDGKRIITTSDDGTARIWRANDPVHPIVHSILLSGHKGMLTSAAFSPDDNHIIAVSDDTTVPIWNVAASADASAPIWNVVGSGNSIMTSTILGEHKDKLSGNVPHAAYEMTEAAFSPNGDHIVTVWNNTVFVWRDVFSSPVAVKPVGKELVGPGGDLASAAWSPRGDHILTAYSDGTAQVWSADGSSSYPLALRDHERRLDSASWSPDGKRIVTVSGLGLVHVWSAEAYIDTLELASPTFGITTASVDSQGIPSVDGKERLWSAYGYSGSNYGVVAAFSPDCKQIVAAYESGIGKKTVAVGGVDDSSKFGVVWESTEGSSVPVGKSLEDRGFVAFSPDGKRVITRSPTDDVLILSADGSSSPLNLKRESGSGRVTAAAFSPDGKLIVSGHMDRTIWLWSVDDSKKFSLGKHEASIYALAFSPDGKRIISASGDKTARIWSADGSGDPLVLSGHEAAVLFAAWSSDGKRVVTASNDGTARIWSADRYSIPIVLRDLRAPVYFAAFSPDGKRVVTASPKGVLRSWPISGELLQQSLREATTDCLSAEMRQTYLGESTTDAWKRYGVCETSYGRTPLPGPFATKP